MREFIGIVLMIGFLGIAAVMGITRPASPEPLMCSGKSETIEVHFSPSGGATEAAVAAIDGARKSVEVQAYSFTSQRIADALIRAQKRGLDVTVIADKGQPAAVNSKVRAVSKAGVKTYIDSAHAIAHNKIILIDGQEILTGSFNFTDSAELHNAENLLTLKGVEGCLMGQYMQNFEKHKAHSRAWLP